MHITSVLSFLILALNAEAIAIPDAAAEDSLLGLYVEKRDISPATPLLEKRACVYNGCKCNSRGRQLTVCGNCVWLNDGSYAVTKKRASNHIFECSPSGACCDYGPASDCGSAGARRTIN